MLTDSQIEILCRKMSIPLAGIFFKDQMPKKIEYNRGYVINIEDSHDGEGLENSGTHWTCLYVAKYPNGSVEPIYFDSYGMPAPEDVKRFVKTNTNKSLPFTTKDIQSLMSSVCGWYVCAFLYAVTNPHFRTGDLYQDVETYMDMFEDLNKGHDFKKNEYILKMFFRSPDENIRKLHPIDLDVKDQEENANVMKIPIDTRMM